MEAPRQIRQVVRRLLRTPAFSAIAVLTLAIGIGANAAIFTVVEGVMLRPLPYPDSDRLIGLWHTAPGLDLPEFEQSNTTYTLYRERTATFEELGLVRRYGTTLGGEGTPERVMAAGATASLFNVLRVMPVRGRTFSETEDDPGGPNVVVLSHELWSERFGLRESVLGETILLDGDPYEVVGVMPAGFAYPNAETRLWTPHVIDPAELGLANFAYWGIGRLAPGATLDEARAEFAAILPALPEAYPGEVTARMMEQASFAPLLRPMKDDVVGDAAQMLWILLGTVGFVLLIACANVANLLLVRAEGRQREMAVRTAMGAGRADVVRAFLAESLVLALAGGALGLALAAMGVKALVALGPENLPRVGEIGVGPPVFLFTVVVSVVAGLVFGAVPAVKYGRPKLSLALKEGGRGGGLGKESHRANNVLVATQIALALMLLIASGLMVRTFVELRSVDPGFEPDDLLTFDVALIPGEIESAAQSASFFQQLLDNLRALPQVVEAGAGTSLPLEGGWSNNALVLEDRPLAEGDLPDIVRTNIVAPGYFESMGIGLLEGRTIERRDHERVTDVAIVNRTAAERFWPGESAVGKRVSPNLPGEDTPWMTVVGVVEDVRDDGLARPAPAMVYYAMATSDMRFITAISRLTLTVRTRGAPTDALPGVRNELWALDARVPIADVRTGADLLAAAAARTSFTMVMLVIAAAVALLLGTIGVYGVISYIVSRRLREFGIRMAMGAAEGRIRGMVVRQGLVVAVVGVVIGILGGLALTRLMGSLLFGISATDPLTFAFFAVALLLVSALASYLPARRASSVDPAEALRYE